MSNEETTIVQLEGAVNEAQNTLKAALKAMEKARGEDVGILIEAADAVKAATAAVTRAENNVKAARFAETAEERNGLTQAIHDNLSASLDFEALDRVGVETLTIKVDIGERTVSIVPTGAQLKAPRATKGGGGNGFKSAGGVRVNGVEYRSVNNAYVTLRAAEDGKDVSEVTPANTESAMRWLTKPERGFTVEAIPAS